MCIHGGMLAIHDDFLLFNPVEMEGNSVRDAQRIRFMHTWRIPVRDTQGHEHDVEYRQEAGGLKAEYEHLPTCWCKRNQSG